MAKTTRHGGASYEAIPINRPTLGGTPSPGNNCSQSSKSTKQPSVPPEVNPRKPVQETENPSQSPATALDSDADTAASVTRKTPPKRSGRATRRQAAQPPAAPAVEDFDDDWI